PCRCTGRNVDRSERRLPPHVVSSLTVHWEGVEHWTTEGGRYVFLECTPWRSVGGPGAGRRRARGVARAGEGVARAAGGPPHAFGSLVLGDWGIQPPHRVHDPARL